MMVANEISIDIRVLKMAHDLAAAGPRVTLLGLSPSSDREYFSLGQANVIRLPHGRQITPSGVPARNPYAPILRLIETTRGWPRVPGRLARGFLWLLIKTARALRSPIRKARGVSLRLRSKWADLMFGVRPRGDWRVALPQLTNLETVFGPELDALAPDVIHAQDVHLLGVGARAVERASLEGRKALLIYDSHEYVQGLATFSPRLVAAWAALEREYIGRADRVITVSPAIAELLVTDYQVDPPPVVVLNIPPVGGQPAVSIREATGLGLDEPLLVYSGGVSQMRGLHTLVAALGRLDGVHLALIIPAVYKYVLDLEEMARVGGYEERLHLLPYVEPQDVVGFLASATVAVSPIVSGPINHETTLPNKIFEYMHARLPIVISDCKAMSEFVEALGIGEVFVSEDVDSLTKTLTRVLGNLDHYRSVYRDHPELFERYSWRTERRKMFGVYQDLLGKEAVAADIGGEGLTSLTEDQKTQVNHLGGGQT